MYQFSSFVICHNNSMAADTKSKTVKYGRRKLEYELLAQTCTVFPQIII